MVVKSWGYKSIQRNIPKGKENKECETERDSERKENKFDEK